MIGLIDWAASRARMVLAFVFLSLVAGGFSYANLPKEGEPDIQIPALVVSVPFQGISTEDSEALLIKPMENRLSEIDGLDHMNATAAEGYAVVFLEFEFGWDKSQTTADVRDAMQKVEADFPAGVDAYTIAEINFSEFPIVVVSLSGEVPERTLVRLAEDMQERLESLPAILSADLSGNREELVEVIIDPLRLESYNISASDLIEAVVQNNSLVPAGQAQSDTSTFALKVPGSFESVQEIYDLPIITSETGTVKIGDLGEIRLGFEDAESTSRYNGEKAISLQVVKRKGFNIIETVELMKAEIASAQALWPAEVRARVNVDVSNDQSRTVKSMVQQLEGSVLTAIALVMIVILASLGTRPALLVGFAIPTSFLLCFVLLALMGVAVSNIVMFGLILAVGVLVDGAIVVVEYADRRMREGAGPMQSYIDAAKRMFWPIVASTATTLCAFLPMLLWPGVPGQFMRMLPVTLIFVLSSALVVTLIFLPVMGGISGRFSRAINATGAFLRPVHVLVRLALLFVGIAVTFLSAQVILRGVSGAAPLIGLLLVFMLGLVLMTVAMSALERVRPAKVDRAPGHGPVGYIVGLMTTKAYMPLVVIAVVVGFVISTFNYFGQNNYGVEFFVETETEQAIIYVRARGNYSLEEKDALLRQAEEIMIAHPGIKSTVAFAGEGGLDNGSGAAAPVDAIGQAQIELIPWAERPAVFQDIALLGVIPFTTSTVDPNFGGNRVIEEIQRDLAQIPGVEFEVLDLAQGPSDGKPVFLRLSGENWDDLVNATQIANQQFEVTSGLIDIENTLPPPGIDWQINVDQEEAGYYGANVAAVGAMVQLVTRGVFLDTMRLDSSNDEIDIRLRLPEEYRTMSTLDELKIRTERGLVPLSNFTSREPVARVGNIARVDEKRVYDVQANVQSGLVRLVADAETAAPETLAVMAAEDVPDSGMIDGVEFRAIPVNATERIGVLTQWLQTNPFPAGIEWEWSGDQQEQQESGAFLMVAFSGALGLMFIILLAQFNSFYNATLVLLAVILSTTGVLIGMLVMQQPFSIIMTGTGIVALAGIVVNNNIVLIDTYQQYCREMPKLEAIARTVEARLRPVLLTTITTMAGLTPMMFGLSLDFLNGGYTLDSPTSLWWKQLATAVVFGLGIATVLTLMFTPAVLALRVWVTIYLHWIADLFVRLSMGKSAQAARELARRSEEKNQREEMAIAKPN